MVLPVLTLILLGVMQFGLLFWSQVTLVQIARDTGRWAASQGWSCGGLNPVDPNAGANIADQANRVAARSTLFGWHTTANRLTLSSGPTYTNGPPPASGGGICPPITNQEVWAVSFELAHTVPVFIPFLADNGCSPECRHTLNAEVQFRMEPRP